MNITELTDYLERFILDSGSRATERGGIGNEWILTNNSHRLGSISIVINDAYVSVRNRNYDFDASVTWDHFTDAQKNRIREAMMVDKRLPRETANQLSTLLGYPRV